jgi:hypothetical protein
MGNASIDGLFRRFGRKINRRTQKGQILDVLNVHYLQKLSIYQHFRVFFRALSCLGRRKIYICKVLAKILKTFTNP